MKTFQDKYLPQQTQLAGLCFIVEKLKVRAPLKDFTVVSKKELQKTQHEGPWTIFSHKYWPGDDSYSHLVFSLKYEDLNLLALKRIFEKIKPDELVKAISSSPTGAYSRKIWFLYEYLTGKKLNLPEVKAVTYVKVLDEDKYFTQKGIHSSRHKVINNLLGIPGFSPMIRKTDKLLSLLEDDLKTKTEKIVRSVDKRLIARAASFLLLSDTKATYEIEDERAPQNRLERWGKVILEAGKNELSLVEIERLHRTLLKDDRFTKIGLRDKEVFLGDRDYNQHPIPEFIGAKHEDLESIMQKWLLMNNELRDSSLHPVLQTALVAFSFVYIHPLEDGNGRLHRYLFHHVLADRGFTPKGIIFPISSVIFDQIEKYKESLTGASSPLLDLIEWETDDKLNVQILNETRDLYQYLDLTKNAEFLYQVVKETIEVNLPLELEELKKYDKAKEALSQYIEMPEGTLSLLINVIKDNSFKLSKSKKTKFFERLTEKEIQDIEMIIKEAYE